MALAAGALLAPHFTAAELDVARPEATDTTVTNARRVAGWLESVRAIVGVPFIITSGFRTPNENTSVGGSATSDHLSGLAADFKGKGLSGYAMYRRLIAARDAGELPAFDQLVFYAADDHVHVGLGSRMRGAILLRTTEGSYVQLAGNAVAQIRGYL